MLAPRLIPVVKLLSGACVITEKFQNPIYVGDPLNVVNQFSQLAADELIILDISMTFNAQSTNDRVIEQIIDHAEMAISYGGGLVDFTQVDKLFDYGYDKVIVRSNYRNFDFLDKITSKYGNQALTICLDINFAKSLNDNKLSINGSLHNIDEFVNYLNTLKQIGVGEILIHDVLKDGTFEGLTEDPLITNIIPTVINCPVVLMGGCSCWEEAVTYLANHQKIHSLAAGAMFTILKKNRSVLLNYPDRIERYQ